jgi:hypothetical protein
MHDTMRSGKHKGGSDGQTARAFANVNNDDDVDGEMTHAMTSRAQFMKESSQMLTRMKNVIADQGETNQRLRLERLSRCCDVTCI